MSNEAITWAYRQTVAAGTKFVLVALADLADEDHSCYPGQAKLAAMTGQCERTVRRQLLELESAGFVVRSRRFDGAGHRTSDRYVLPVGQIIPTGQYDRRSNQPPVRMTTGQDDHRSNLPVDNTTDSGPIPDNAASLPANLATGQNGQVSLREITTKPKDKTFSSDIALRDDVERICEHLAEKIEANGSRRPNITQRWRTAARLLLDVDKRPEEKIMRAIDWCQGDEFWRTVVLSMPKLREKYDQMQLVAQRSNGPPSRAAPLPTTDQRVQIGVALVERLERMETA